MTTEPATLARTAIQKLLDGAAPNGIAPDSCGAWRETVSALYAEYENDGTPGVKRLFNSLTIAHPDLARLVSASEPSWKPPLTFTKIDLPPFPLHVFPDWVRACVEAVTEAMQTPTDLAGMLALAVLSTCCARRFVVEPWSGWREQVNVYVVVSMLPGTRKSPVFRALTSALVTWEKQQKHDAEIRRKRAEAERHILEQMLDAAKSKAAKAKDDDVYREAMDQIDTLAEQLTNHVVPVEPTLIVDDVTPETISSLLADQGGRLACLSAEGDIFGIMAGRYSSGAPNIGVFLKGHSGDVLRVNRKTRTDYVDKPALTMGITTQPEVLQAFGRNSTFKGTGLLARFFYALPESTVGDRDIRPMPVPPQVQQTYDAHIRDLLAYTELLTAGSVNSVNSVSARTPEGYDEPSSESILSEQDMAHQDAENRGSVNSVKDHINEILLSIYLSTESIDLFTAFLEWLEPQLRPGGPFSGMVDWASKLGGGILRIAGLLHMAEMVCHNRQNRQNTISADTIARAIEVAQYLIPHAYAAYQEVGADPLVKQAEAIVSWMEEKRLTRFTKRDASRALTGTFKKASELDAPLELLIDREYIRAVETEERDGKAGRNKSPEYDVNPILFSSKEHTPVHIPAFTR